ncbi:hypothetical protein DYB36_011031 [Aphanomyces astaci]|uniref:PCI domain-containing protein n=1 Tax=Aphanomyces astaci TaxID=112090 RepID=A0A397B6G1_APHAT|nr:hypothetical protein DYB36_011031 [Aphanomyces astaci]
MVASDDGSLEQFTLLAKTARGRACVALIQQVLSNKKLFVFGELLDMPNVKALAESDQSDQQGHARLLAIFAHGRYLDYVRQKEDATFHIPDLNAAQALKLRKLTVVSLCQQHKSVPHATAVEAEKAERDLSVKNTVAAVRLQAKDRHLPGSDVDPELIYGDGHGGSYHRPISGPGYSRMIATFSMSLSMIGV